MMSYEYVQFVSTFVISSKSNNPINTAPWA